MSPTILIVALSGFLMGFDGSLFTGAVIFIQPKFSLSIFEMGWAVIAHTLTATIAILCAGAWWIQRESRKAHVGAHNVTEDWSRPGGPPGPPDPAGGQVPTTRSLS
jgi:hypothetical protein